MKTALLRKKFFNCSALLAALVALTAQNASSATNDLFYAAADVHSVLFCHQDLNDRTTNSLPPVIVCSLSEPETLLLEFDILEADAEPLYYMFAHAKADWSPSDLMEMEFVDGLNKVYGEDSYSTSFNTTASYVHHSIRISTEPIKISGNFFVEVRTEHDDPLVLRRPLWISENTMGVKSRVVRSGALQNLMLAVVTADNRVAIPEEEMRVAVWQNRRTDDMRIFSKPTFLYPGEVVFMDTPELSFQGGTEWRWADTRSISSVKFGAASIEFHEPFYHYTLPLDRQARAYSFHEDFNGGEWVETYDRIDDTETAADYAVVHFSFAPEDPSLLFTHDFYVIGDATGWEPSSANHLTPDAQTMTLAGQCLLKQGLHNYLYVARPRKSHAAPSFALAEGSFHQTENDYYVAVYLRSPGETYDHLVCFKKHNTLKTPDEFIR